MADIIAAMQQLGASTLTFTTEVLGPYRHALTDLGVSAAETDGMARDLAALFWAASLATLEDQGETD